METLNLKDLKDLKLTANESKDIIKRIAKKRSTTTKKILETINKNQKRRINKKTNRKTTKTSRNTTKSNRDTTKNNKNTTKTKKNKKIHAKKIP